MSNELIQAEQSLAPIVPRMATLLAGSKVKVEHLMQTILISCERNPALLQANRQSLLAAAVSAAVLRLPVDGVTGQAHLVPYKGRVQLIPGYRGLITLAARATFSVLANIVREGDEFDLELGSEPRIRHKPVIKPAEEQAKKLPMGAYAVFRSKFFAPVVHWMPTREIMEIRDRSAGYRSGKDSPWITHPTAMVLKTPIRHGAKFLPHETARDLALATALESEHDRGLLATLDDAGLVHSSRIDDGPEIEAVPDLAARLAAPVPDQYRNVGGSGRPVVARSPVDVLLLAGSAKDAGLDMAAWGRENAETLAQVRRADPGIGGEIDEMLTGGAS